MGLLLTGEETRMHIFTVTRKGKGISVERRKQYKYENLAEKFVHKKAEPFIVTVEPRTDGKKPSKNSHPGQEFVITSYSIHYTKLYEKSGIYRFGTGSY